MKWIICILFLFVNISSIYSQDSVTIYTDHSNLSGNTEEFKISKYSRYVDENFDFNLINFIDSHVILADELFKSFSVRVMSAHNAYSEHKFEHGATTHKIVITTSEFGEAPYKNLFIILPLFNPKLITLDAIDFENTKLVIEHGYYDQRKITEFKVNFDDVKIVQ